MNMTTLRAVCRLARANMTVISAVTYLAAAVLATNGEVRATPYFAGWAFVILTQFMTHFLGEVADARSDKLNKYCTPITGGSGVLPADGASVAMANAMGYTTAAAATLVLRFAVPPPARRVGAIIQLLAWAYSAEPVKLNHRCLGELDASVVTNVLLPYFAACVQGAASGTGWWERRLAILVVPAFFVKLSLFIVLNLADKRADWATGKLTLAGWLGPRICARLHAALMCVAYASAALIAVADGTRAVLLFFLPSVPYALGITRALARQPYSVAPWLGPALLHSTLLVWGVFLHTLVTSGVNGLRFYHAIAATFLYITLEKTIAGRRRAARAAAKAKALAAGDGEPTNARRVRPVPALPLGDPLEARNAACGKRVYADVLVVGAGLQGIVMTAALRRRGLDAFCLDAGESGCQRAPRLGATVLLSPSEIEALAQLGLPRTYLNALPSVGNAAAAPRDELLERLRAATRGMVAYNARVTRMREDECADCIRASHTRQGIGAVVARVAVGTSSVAAHVEAARTREPRGPADCTPRTLALNSRSPRPITDALRLASLLAELWTQPDGHLEAFYRTSTSRVEATHVQF